MLVLGPNRGTTTVMLVETPPGGHQLPGLGHNTTRNVKTAVSRRRLGETMASYPTPGISKDVDPI